MNGKLNKLTDWVGTDCLAVELNCTPSMVLKWLKEGMPHEKVGRKYQFNVKDVNDWFLFGWFESLEPEEQYHKISQFYPKKKAPARRPPRKGQAIK